MVKFKVGDIVRLKSGGPKMTVNPLPASPDAERLAELEHGQDERTRCSWFDGKKFLSEVFHADALEPVRKQKQRRT
jgi:uncharacterized protein YodC (DUF2158 family)